MLNLLTFFLYFLFVLQIPELGVAKYASQILSVIVALIEDTEEEVALEAVQGLGKVRSSKLIIYVALLQESLRGFHVRTCFCCVDLKYNI